VDEGTALGYATLANEQTKEPPVADANSDLNLRMTGEIVSAFISKNQIAIVDLPALIKSVHQALEGIRAGDPTPEPKKAPAISVRGSITPDFLVCLEDGRSFKSLKRHIRTKYNLTPEGYRTKWGLPKGYPMVAPNYSAVRSALAKAMGLGSGGRQAKAVEIQGSANSTDS
jgi:predicted transcriptional regulator